MSTTTKTPAQKLSETLQIILARATRDYEEIDLQRRLSLSPEHIKEDAQAARGRNLVELLNAVDSYMDDCRTAGIRNDLENSKLALHTLCIRLTEL
jgi:hypothetical protein